MLIVSSVSVAINGTITANGGRGGPDTANARVGNGGGGRGGAIHLLAPSISGTGTLRALGGGSGNSALGSYGRIRLEAFEHQFTGSINPANIWASPFKVFLPTTNFPQVSSTLRKSVAG